MMPAVSLNGLQARADHLNHLVFAKAHQLGERGPHAFLIVRNQYAHDRFRTFHVNKIFPADEPATSSKGSWKLVLQSKQELNSGQSLRGVPVCNRTSE